MAIRSTMFSRYILFMVVAVSSCVFATKRDSIIVYTIQGPVKGYRDQESGLFIFYNIPYATAPTGPDKFKAPLPPPKWSLPYEAVDQKVICPQVNLGISFLKHINVQENCLIANIYLPDTTKSNLPVIVHIHGGGYQIGSGELLQQKNVVKSKKFILVTFNYRLGVNGFLCLGTKDVPGNAGLKDQLALLRWIKKNIASFGGNPDDVTISGFSAGSAAVDLLMISKAAEGLFNKVIPESGASVGVWCVQLDPLENAKAFARQLNFTNVDDVYALEEFYKTASFESLTSDSFMFKPDSTLSFTPCIERDIGEERIIDDAPVNILKEGKYKRVPMFYGFANMEGIFRITFGYDQWKNIINEHFLDFLPADLQFDNNKQREKIAKKIREFYFGDKIIGNETIVSYIDYFSDVMFKYPTLRAIKLHIEAGHDKIYLYEFSFPDPLTPMTPKILEKVKGADHFAQSTAVADGLGMGSPDENNIPSDYRKMKKVMRKLRINFVITGKPVPEGSSLPSWPPVSTTDCSPHMSLDKTLQLRGPLLKEQVEFWDDIYKRYYRTPIPPPQLPSRSKM